MRPTSPTGLYWSTNGGVACEKHVPPPDDRRWRVEGWEPIPVSSGHLRGARYRCQYCAANGRSVVHHDGSVH